MTDRHSGYIVVLDDDIREDDAEAMLNALRMVKGVQSVEPIVSDYQQHIATERALHEFEGKLLEFLRSLKPAR